MWAGGQIEWRKPLIIGGKACARANVSSVYKKGFDGVAPMVFVNQRIEIMNEGEEESAVLEDRTHVYRGLGTYQRTAREGRPCTVRLSICQSLMLNPYHPDNL